MNWSPRWKHITQLHPPALSGWADCWEASLARYLRERDPAVIVLDDWNLINQISLVARGVSDNPGNADTTLGEAEVSLAHYGVAGLWTTDFHAVLNAPWSICLVDGTQLAPAQYPASWFPESGQANHFILWMPNYLGSATWFNDPLAYDNNQQDCSYDLKSVAAAFYGAYLLPTTGHGETPPATWKALRGFGLLAQPRHGSLCLATVPSGGTGLVEAGTSDDGAGTVWQRGQFRFYHGWFPKEYVKVGE